MSHAKLFEVKIIDRIFREIEELKKKGFVRNDDWSDALFGPNKDKVSKEWCEDNGSIALTGDNMYVHPGEQVATDGEIYLEVRMTVAQSLKLLQFIRDNFKGRGLRDMKQLQQKQQAGQQAAQQRKQEKKS